MISVNLVPNFILVQIIGFLVLVLILNVLLYKPVLEIIQKRQHYVTNLLDEVQKLNLEAQAQLDKYKQEKLKAEEEGKRIYNSLLGEAKKFKEEKSAQLNEMFKKEQSAFETQIKQEIASESVNLDAITSQISTLLVNNILKSEV